VGFISMPGCACISVNEAAVSADSLPCKIQKVLSQMSYGISVGVVMMAG